ncbi:MAG TPA: tRNA (adenosine(37)-N6)-threonylcarbamoyltransferase complex ATPase subunit type 1 TsaE [Candidatus Dormibacteraeota bacterium]|nr:tRNA (adenosine(37)-N6)-threonylcarbamoyltransferase complex ATPase subunit type 1 TsaE [Candidatus Dormibacteraeota bacterium]
MASGTSESMPTVNVRTHSDEETRTLGRQIGAQLKAGDCIALRGELGAGKTVMAQGVVAGAGGGDDVRSPTFLLHAVHQGRLPVHHLDLYRMDVGTDLRTLGIDEALLDGAVLVEWPERTGAEWFTGEVRLEIASATERDVTLKVRRGLRGET